MLRTEELNNLSQIESKAKNNLDKSTYDFIAGGAGNEWSLQNNISSFNSYQIVPRVLQNITEVDTSIKLFGSELSCPIIPSPCAFQKLVHPQGELETARACEEFRTVMSVSTMSTFSIEKIARETKSDKWFQLYMFKDTTINESLVSRAEHSAYKAIIVTVDVPAMGMRYRDINNKFSLPSSCEAANFINEELKNLSNKTNGSKIKDHTDTRFESNIGWPEIKKIKSLTKLPVIVKGILHPEDADAALVNGIDGVIVSNHGGRQIGTSISAIDALPNIVQRIKGQIPILLDGGIRGGEEAFKALALGADCVMIGRPIFWALAAGGRDQLLNTFHILENELKLTMRLSGCDNLQTIKNRGISQINSDKLFQLKIALLEQQVSQLLKSQNLSTIDRNTGTSNSPCLFNKN